MTETGPAAPQAGGGGEPQAGSTEPQAGDATTSGEPQAGAATTDDTTQPDDSPGEAALRRELAAARREAAASRVKLRTYEDAEKTELVKATERAAELEKELEAERDGRRTDRLELATATAARKLGFRSPELAFRLIGAGEVKYDDDGKPTNVDELLKAVAKQDPYLVNGKPDFGGGPRGEPAGGATDMNASSAAPQGAPAEEENDLATYNDLIDRTDVGALIPEDVAADIIQGLPAASVALGRFRRATMSRAQQRLPVLSVAARRLLGRTATRASSRRPSRTGPTSTSTRGSSRSSCPSRRASSTTSTSTSGARSGPASSRPSARRSTPPPCSATDKPRRLAGLHRRGRGRSPATS